MDDCTLLKVESRSAPGHSQQLKALTLRPKNGRKNPKFQFLFLFFEMSPLNFLWLARFTFLEIDSDAFNHIPILV